MNSLKALCSEIASDCLGLATVMCQILPDPLTLINTYPPVFNFLGTLFCYI